MRNSEEKMRDITLEFTEEQYAEICETAADIGLPVEEYVVSVLEGRKDVELMVQKHVLHKVESLLQYLDLDPDSKEYKSLQKHISEFKKEIGIEADES